MKVIINNTVYDITTFIPEHPGGTGVFLTDDSTPQSTTIPDITEKFNEVGHSEYAVNLLGNYKLNELSDDDPRFRRDCKLEYNKTKISKLVTHEDKFHIHKIMGLVSLLNYFYLGFDCFYSGAQATITLRSVDTKFIGLTWLHSILSLSALQFLIPRTRTGIMPMIWQEFRAHSIIFAVRSFLIINLLYFLNLGFLDMHHHHHQVNTNPNPNPNPNVVLEQGPGVNIAANMVVRGMAVLVAMKLADISTHFLRENRKETTTATMPYWSDCSPRLQSAIKYFYTHSQFMATAVCLFSDIPYILAVAFPIQIASFLMTLVRKNIISAFWYHALYASSLLSVYAINARDPALYPISAVGVFLIYVRVNLKLNKYVLWTMVAVIGGLLRYAAVSNASYDDKVRVLSFSFITWFTVHALFILLYHFSSKSMPEFGKLLTAALFDVRNRREESNHRVRSNVPVAGDSSFNTIAIQLCDKYPAYKPGMYFNLYYDTKKRPYTPVEYASGADGDVATFLIKRVPGGEVSPLLCDKYIMNQTIFVKGPFGRKYYDPSPDVTAFMCNDVKITSKVIVMCSCGSGITPLYSMGVAWSRDVSSRSQKQELHYLSSYRTRADAVISVVKDSGSIDNNYNDDTDRGVIRERLFISSENTKMAPAALIEYLSTLVEGTSDVAPKDVAVFICGTPSYSQMVKDSCAIFSRDIECYEW